MAFFGDVRLRPAEAANLAKLASAVERVAVAVEAMLAKLNEPPEDESELQARIDDMARRLTEANDKLEAAAQSAPGA